jgi:uncharacterized protein (DUF58 family)
MDVKPVDYDDGIIYISQSKLIALQRDAGLLKQKPGKIKSRLSGNYLSPFKGRGMEFDEARPYQPGDDIRNMDWRVTARTNKPHSKVFREERERPVLLWVDFRRSMFFGTRQCFKSVLAARVAALLAWEGCKGGDRLGGLLFSEQQHQELRPARGKTAALHLIRQLSEFSHLQTDSIDVRPDKMNDASHALKRLVHVERPGSLIYLVSDFRNMSSQLESTLNRLSRHNELVMIHLFDPLEAKLPSTGFYRVSDGVSEAEINAADNRGREKYQHRFEQHQNNLQMLCQRNKVRYLSLATEQPLLPGLRQNTDRSTKRVSAL